MCVCVWNEAIVKKNEEFLQNYRKKKTFQDIR